MGKLSWIAVLAAVLAVVPARATARGEDAPSFEGKPFQLALFDPVQIVSHDEGVSGVGLNIIYGRNAFLRGVSLGIVNVVDKDVMGYQWGAVNLTGGNNVGGQFGLVSIANGKLEGLQAGIVTVAGSTSGFQLGLVNHTETMTGIQIGAVNVIERGGWLPVTIIVNGSFP